MKEIIIILGLVFSSVFSFSQTEKFDILSYTINDVEYEQFEPSTNAGAYIHFTIYKEKPFFILGVAKDSTFSYGYIEKQEEYDVAPIDTANLVIFNSYLWHYANTYNYKTGTAIIKTYRIFYTNTMLLMVNIEVNDKFEDESDYVISVLAENKYY